jgi:hypothetical protein
MYVDTFRPPFLVQMVLLHPRKEMRRISNETTSFYISESFSTAKTKERYEELKQSSLHVCTKYINTTDKEKSKNAIFAVK